MFILSPEQVKFDKNKLEERLLLDTAGAIRGAVDPAVSEERRQSPMNDSNHHRQESRALQRNLDADLSQLSSSTNHPPYPTQYGLGL
jgi:hypothetical protein